MPKWRIRKIQSSKSEVRKLKKLLDFVHKSTEIKRINIMIEYLSGSNMEVVYKKLRCSKETISKTIQWYLNDKESFYKTNHKWWYGARVNWFELKSRVKMILKIMLEKWVELKIENICGLYNKIYDESLSYHKMWIILKKKLKIDILTIKDVIIETKISQIDFLNSTTTTKSDTSNLKKVKL